MATYLLAYHGGGMAETPEEQEKVMNDWMAWFGTVGDAMRDPGMPVVGTKTIDPDGAVSDGGGANPVTGYSVIDADSMEAAIALAQACPVLASGSTIEVAEVGLG